MLTRPSLLEIFSHADDLVIVAKFNPESDRYVVSISRGPRGQNKLIFSSLSKKNRGEKASNLEVVRIILTSAFRKGGGRRGLNRTVLTQERIKIIMTHLHDHGKVKTWTLDFAKATA